MPGLFQLTAVAAVIAAALSAWGYSKTKKPGLALLAGALIVYAAAVVWRSFVAAPEHQPWMR